MIKFIRFVTYLFYDYYSEGPRAGIKYIAALGAMTGLCYLNLFAVLILLRLEFIIPDRSGSKALDYIKMFLFLLPIYLVFRFIAPEKYLAQAEYDPESVIVGKFWLVFYFIFSIAALIVVINLKK